VKNKVHVFKYYLFSPGLLLKYCSINQSIHPSLPPSLLWFFVSSQELEYFFFLHQNQNIFFSNIGNQNIFLEKNHNPPFKLNGRSLSKICRRHNFSYHRYADETQVYLVIYPDAWRLLNQTLVCGWAQICSN
jgi:hypothetical protein